MRTFISFEVPGTPAVEEARDRLRGIRGVSVPKDVHLTMRFLGDVEAKKVEALSSRMASLEGHRPFAVSLRGLGAFPNRKEPRVVWVGAEIGPPFYEILSDLDSMLGGLSIGCDGKPFKAHVTIGRVREPSAGLAAFLEEKREMDAGSFECGEILLMKSVLAPGGAEHSVVGAFRLSGGG
ncbi:MAG: RNA 2',3'-cyclic phosphodiesterase [Methanomassiliicoccaceae archaeon]|nr:RNA 2',3'-cyclic phosphodiesterase [Methanomassiliicoccaceae archaeon]